MDPLPQAMRNKAIAMGAADWLDALPGLVRSLEAEWRLSVDRSYRDATEAFVAPAHLANGTPIVLKLVVPSYVEAARHEITALQLDRGRACARLLRHDEDLGALLLEQLGRPLHDLGLPIGTRLDILCDLAARMWRPAPDVPLPTGAEKGRWLVRFITNTWEELNRPCPARAVDYALTCAAARIDAHDDECAVLVHGDVNEWNSLATNGGFRLVDPDGLLAEPEYDLGVLMREDPIELIRDGPRGRARSLAARTGLDPQAIWEWGAVERVSTGLLCTKIDLQPIGRDMLAAADRIADA